MKGGIAPCESRTQWLPKHPSSATPTPSHFDHVTLKGMSSFTFPVFPGKETGRNRNTTLLYRASFINHV